MLVDVLTGIYFIIHYVYISIYFISPLLCLCLKFIMVSLFDTVLALV